MYVFVYGTLKKHEPNHHWLADSTHGSAKFVACGTLKHKYPLVIASKYNIPFLLDAKGIGLEISGEVYEIDEEMLKNLDILENYPKLYTRREEPVVVQPRNLVDPDIIYATAYLLSQYSPELLNRPYLDNYSSEGPHGLRYMSRYLRDKEEMEADEVGH